MCFQKFITLARFFFANCRSYWDLRFANWGGGSVLFEMEPVIDFRKSAKWPTHSLIQNEKYQSTFRNPAQTPPIFLPPKNKIQNWENRHFSQKTVRRFVISKMFAAIFLDKNFEDFPSFNKKWHFFQSFGHFFMKVTSR